MTLDDEAGGSHVFRRFALFLTVEAETGTFFHKMAGAVELSIPFYLELRTVAMPSDEETIVEFDADPANVLLLFWLFPLTEQPFHLHPLISKHQIEKPDFPFHGKTGSTHSCFTLFGNPATFLRPVALRPGIASGLLVSERCAESRLTSFKALVAR